MMQLEGFVNHIIHRNPSNGYTVLSLATNDSEEVLTGIFRDIEEGAILSVKGDFVLHSVYGNQFKVKSYEFKEPEDIVSIERYLASGTIKGIGATMAKRIVNAYKEDTFRVMEEEPERLVEIKGISERIARSIAEQMQEKRGMRKTMMFLQELGIGASLSAKIYAKYENNVLDIIEDNPYRLVEDIQGVGFKTADDIARRAGISTDSVYRIKCGILYVLSMAGNEGHIYLPKSLLIHKAHELLEVNDELIENQIESLSIDKKIIVKLVDDVERVYSHLAYYIELDCARMLVDLDIISDESDEYLIHEFSKIEKNSGVTLDEKQRNAVILSARRGISVITGGPGTGKTTIIKMLLEYFDKSGQDVLLAAPTGRAAKRMTETTGYEARTIHRLLEIGAEQTMQFARNDMNPLETDVIIIDEMSMVDIYLFHSLLKALCIGTRLIMVGDASQLPSVGPGAVLKDIIDSKRFVVSTLEHIFRQSEQSDIVVNAHKINRGESILLDNKSSDFFFLERNDVNVIIEGMVYLITQKLPPYVQAKPFDIQVMTPMRKGVLGVENLNRVLQDRMNPAAKTKKEILQGDLIFREGDKVMQVKNNYQIEWTCETKKGLVYEQGTGIFNGDMGIIASIDTSLGQVKVIFDDGRVARYSLAMLEELELAYAITIHKSQGSEYPAVVIPLLSGPEMLMNRNLLYTAVTRAKKCVTIIGSSSTVKAMIDNQREQIRYSSLNEQIKEI